MMDQKINGVAGVVVAGGMSRRMGCDKALIPWRGKPLISYPIHALAQVFKEVVIVSRSSDRYGGFGLPVVPDAFDMRGSLVGIYSGLAAVSQPAALIVACDMPCISVDLVRMLVSEMDDTVWGVVPEGPAGPEPLLAVYSKKCLQRMSEYIQKGDLKISRVFENIPVAYISPEKVAQVDPMFRSFINVNTPQEMEEAGSIFREGGRFGRSDT